MTAMIDIADANKTFTMHLQGGIELPVVRGVTFHVNPGECVVLSGPSGAGKSSILKMIFGNYRCDSGRIGIHHRGALVDLATAEPRQVLNIRRATIGYVSQFLRAVPRVATLDVVAEPLIVNGLARAEAQARAGELLHRLNIPERLWQLPPATFSGGEQPARQHRARLHLGSADPAARRADRVARRRQPRRRGRAGSRKEAPGRRHGRHCP
ncbi:phosphonate C-P lyase system protein PhnL [Bradyrhizobium sp. GM22.5]